MSKKKHSESNNQYVVGIGASAGGLEALREFLGNLSPKISGYTFIVAQHLSPRHKSLLVQLLSGFSELPIEEATNRKSIRNNTIYIAPPNTDVIISNGYLKVTRPSGAGPKPSINLLFESLAKEFREKAVAIILSGTGTDGSSGAVEVVNNGGTLIVQEPSSAKYDGMPNACINLGITKNIFTPADIGKKFEAICANKVNNVLAEDIESDEDRIFKDIFNLLNKQSKVNFRYYKQSTISRRIYKRLSSQKFTSLSAYYDYLASNNEELDLLFQSCLIGITEFYRDKNCFNSLKKVIKEYISSIKEKRVIRIWCPGCSSGEEPYSIAILFDSLISELELEIEFQIFATDIDERSLQKARVGRYGLARLKNLPEHYIHQYFENIDNEFEINKFIRSRVMFSRHDITSSAPFLKIDLIVCRNLLIYFGDTLQRKIIPMFHYSLKNDGILFLGKSESLGDYHDLFSVIDSNAKIFKRKIGSNLMNFDFFNNSGLGVVQNTSPHKSVRKSPDLKNMAFKALTKGGLISYLIVNDSYNILEIGGDVGAFLSLPEGAMNASLLKMIRPELLIEVRSIILKAFKTNEVVSTRFLKLESPSVNFYVRLVARPFSSTDELPDLVFITFERITVDDLQVGNRPISDSDERDEYIKEIQKQLQETRSHLQDYIEELETTNEELQSLNEELQSANEELQSANEELETANEELQSTNEEVLITYSELRTTNDLLESKERDLKLRYANMESVLKGALQGIILIDANYALVEFNNPAQLIIERFFGKELAKGKSIIDCFQGNALSFFIEKFKEAFAGKNLIEEYVSTENEVPIHLLFSLSPVSTPENVVENITLSVLDISEIRRSKRLLDDKDQLILTVFEAVDHGIGIIGEDGTIVDVNSAFCSIYGFQKEGLLGEPLTILAGEEVGNEYLLENKLLLNKGETLTKNILWRNGNGENKNLITSSRIIKMSDGKKYRIETVRDVTHQVRSEKRTLEISEVARVGGWELNLLTEELYWSPVTKAIHEMPADFIPNLETAIDFYEGDHFKKRITFLVEQLIQKGIPYAEELKIITGSGKVKWVKTIGNGEFDGNRCLRIYGTFQDIHDKKLIELQINAQNDILANFFDSAIDLVCTLDKDGKFINVSRACKTILGFEQEEMIGCNYSEFLIEEDVNSTDQTLEQVVKGAAVNSFKNRYRTKDNKIVNLMWSAVWIKEQDQVFCIGRDITLNEKADYEIKKLSERLNSTVQSLQDGFMIISSTWKLEFMNHRAEELLMLDRWKAHEIRISEIFGPDVTKSLQHVMTNRAAEFFEFYLPDKKLWLEFSIYPSTEGISVFFRNITENKEEQIQLRLFQSAFTSSIDGICITDASLNPPGPSIVYVNKAFCEITGYSRSELIGNSPRMLQGKNTDKLTLERIKSKLLQFQPIEEELINYTKEGVEYWIQISIIPVLNQMGECTHYIALERDISKKKQQELERESLIKELTETNKELREFSYITSHNLRSPLSNLLGLVQLINKESLDRENETLLSAFENNVKRLNETVNDLSKILMIKEGKVNDRTQINFQESLDSVISQLGIPAVREINWKINFSNAPFVSYKKVFLDSLFLNFISNSMKYKSPERALEISVSTYSFKDTVVLTYSDNGRGLNMDKYGDRLFRLYERFHPEMEGRGLGLYLTKSQLESMNASINAEGAEDKGLTFTITFSEQ